MEENIFPRKRKSRVFIWIVIALIILGMAFLASIVFAYKFYSTSKKVIENNPPASFLETIKDIAAPELKSLRGQNEGRINILLVGLAGENYPGENLTDSIIIASINPKTYQTALLSIPRDLYVCIPETSSFTKINALYARGHDRQGKTTDGVEDLKKSLSEITGLVIHYYVAIDFDGFKQVIDALDGINIQVPKDFRDERYPGPNYSYETFEIEKGLHALDGPTALKYARTRHDEDGDFGRAYRQQQILEATRQKAFSVGTLFDLSAINNILNILGEHLRTDIPLDELASFQELSKKIDTHVTANKVLDAGKPGSLLAVSHVFLGNVRAFVLLPRTGSYGEIAELAENIFDLDTIRRKEEEMKKEDASAKIINRSGSPGLDKKLAVLLGKLGYSVKTGQAQSKKNAGLNQNASIAKTLVFDMSHTKPFSLEDISKKLSAQASQDASAEYSSLCQGADFCVVAGSDLTESVDYEENTIEELEQGYDKQQIDEREYIELLKKGSNKKF